MFDPYHKWLGIPKDQRPPTHYQLLGIAPGESDTEVIEEAAVRQTAHVRTYQIGQHAAEATRLLNEISQAKMTLVHPTKRKAYDDQLYTTRTAQVTAKAPMAVAVAAPPAVPAFRLTDNVTPIVPLAGRTLDIRKRGQRGSGTLWIIVGAMLGILALGATILIIAFARRTADPAKPPIVAKKEEKKEVKLPVKIQEPIEKENPPIVVAPPPKKKPKQFPQPPIGVKANVAGARSFKIDKDVVEWMSVSPDGTKVALGRGGPHVYDLTTGQHLTTFPWPMKGGAIHTPVAFHPDSKRVLYAWGCETFASLGDVTTGLPKFSLNPPDVRRNVASVAVSPDGKKAFTDYSHLLVLWNLDTQQEIKRWDFKQMVNDIVFTPDGSRAVLAEIGGGVSVYDLGKLERVGMCKVAPQLRSLAMAPDGQNVVVGSTTGAALVDLKGLNVRMIPLPGNDNGAAVALCAGGKQLLTGGRDGVVRVWDVATLKPVAAWTGHAAPVTRIGVDAKERIAVSGDQSGTVFVWPLPEGLIQQGPLVEPGPAPKGGLVEADLPAGAPPANLREIGNGRIRAAYRLEILRDGAGFITGGLELTHWSMAGNPIRSFAKRTSVSNRLGMGVSAEGKLVVWGEGADGPRIFEVATGKELAQPPRPPQPASVSALALSPDGTRLVTVFGDKSVSVWDVAKEQATDIAQTKLFSLAFAPDGKHVLWSQIGGKAALVDVSTWEVKAQQAVGVFPNTPAFTPDGKMIAILTGNKGVQLLEAPTLAIVGDLAVKGPQQAAFCAGGELLIVRKQAERSLTVWDVAKRAPVAAWELPETVQVFAIAPDESLILAVTQQGRGYTWPLPKKAAEFAAAGKADR